jgi:hypothetical protein
MITIRSSAASSEPTLIGLEVILTTAQGVYTISSKSSGADSSSTFSGVLFGAISWPLSRFQLAPGVVLDQQMFFSKHPLHPKISSHPECPLKFALHKTAVSSGQIW